MPRGVEEVEDSLESIDDYDCQQESECRAEESLVYDEDQLNRLHEPKQEDSKEQRQSRSERRKGTEEQSSDPLEPEQKRRKLIKEIEELNRDIQSNRQRPNELWRISPK
ncbi:unnamed protein product [Haemonchus placei]|uniref:BHLH domain-containing protein n=1 Tax=Haemonchus placei TaxID=6290 RepID=A0A0N4WVT3_HAEPC|nr:unnamed protein product [Haemonchus placei]